MTFDLHKNTKISIILLSFIFVVVSIFGSSELRNNYLNYYIFLNFAGIVCLLKLFFYNLIETSLNLSSKRWFNLGLDLFALLLISQFLISGLKDLTFSSFPINAVSAFGLSNMIFFVQLYIHRRNGVYLTILSTLAIYTLSFIALRLLQTYVTDQQIFLLVQAIVGFAIFGIELVSFFGICKHQMLKHDEERLL